LRFASFLDDRDTDVVKATNEHIVAYREARLTKAERPGSSLTWRREDVVIRGLYRTVMRAGGSEGEPCTASGRASALSRPWHSGPDIRPLTQTQWAAFRDVGLAGRTVGGALDPSWRGRAPLRSQAGAQLAVSTGMRLAEFSTLLDAELPS